MPALGSPEWREHLHHMVELSQMTPAQKINVDALRFGREFLQSVRDKQGKA